MRLYHNQDNPKQQFVFLRDALVYVGLCKSKTQARTIILGGGCRVGLVGGLTRITNEDAALVYGPGLYFDLAVGRNFKRLQF